MRVALVHDWLDGMRGGEKCLEVLCEMFPEATLYALVHVNGSVSPRIESMRIRTSFVQRLPFARRHFRTYLPLFPSAIESMDLREYDLVISSSHCVAKGVIPAPGARHLCYCHTPMRYIWSAYSEYFGRGRAGVLRRVLAPVMASGLRRWDQTSSVRVDRFVANSRNVKSRIQRCYGRDSVVVPPPVETGPTYLSQDDKGYYLVVAALVPYKRVDLAVDTFGRLGKPLVVVGDGPEAHRLRRRAHRNVEFRGWVSDEELREAYAHCRAFVVPGEEDFGMAAVEAQCYGKPVIAYARGGSLETVRGRPLERGEGGGDWSGVFFSYQTVEALSVAVELCDETPFDGASIRAHALRYDSAVYRRRMSEVINDVV